MTLSKISKRIPQKKSFKPVQDQVNVLVEQIRTWRDDAFYQRLYPSALFWGEKIVSMTGYQEPMDIYYLAQIYYLNQEYLQCKELLSRKHLSFSSLWCKLLAAQCCIKLELWEETLELLGESTGFQSQQALDVRLSNQHGRGIQIEASLYQLRGIAYLNQGLKQRAKEELLEALRIDPHCYDALQTLLDNYMLTTNEEGELLQGLSFDGMPAFEAEFIKALYLSKVSPLGKMDIITQVHDTLLDTYHLSSCPLVLIGKAEVAMVQFDYEKASSTLQSILKDHQYHEDALTLYVVCLSFLEKVNLLFTICHDLVDLFPKKSLTWFAVGTYYLTIKKYAEARRYFGKATAIEPGFGQAWIGFAHSFAFEGEHDSAVSIYSSACKVLPGSHVPKMYLGMEHARLKNWKLAQEFLTVALHTCSTDPLLHNELGTLYYEKEEYELAINHYNKVLELVGVENPKRIWVSTLCNLGHTYRKLGQFFQAKKYFDQVNELEEAQESAYSGLALIAYAEERVEVAIHYLHQALAINPDNRNCTLLLDSFLHQLAQENSKNPLPVLGPLLDSDLLDSQLQEKLSKDADDIMMPDMDQDPILADPDDIPVIESEEDETIPQEMNPSVVLSKGRLRSRLSNALDLSPDVFDSGRPRKGLLNFHSSPVNEPRTPPRHSRLLFATRAESPFESNEIDDSSIFEGQDVDMELDDSD